MELTNADLLDGFRILQVDRNAAHVVSRGHASPRGGRSNVAVLQVSVRPARQEGVRTARVEHITLSKHAVEFVGIFQQL